MSSTQHFPQHMDKVRSSAPSLCPSPLTLPHHLSPQNQGFSQAAGRPNSEGQELASSCLMPPQLKPSFPEASWAEHLGMLNGSRPG